MVTGRVLVSATGVPQGRAIVIIANQQAIPLEPEVRASCAARTIAVAATKAERFVGEMHEIAATQAAAGLTPALFEAMAEVYEVLARTPLAAAAPEDIDGAPVLEDVLEELCGRKDLNLHGPKPTGT